MWTRDGTERARVSNHANRPTRAGLAPSRGPAHVPGLDLDYLRRLVDSVPEARADKVTRLKQALADGVYAVDAEAVAQRILLTWKSPRA